MLNCTKIQGLLSQYATGELVNPLQELVGDHLQQCTVCRQELDTELQLLETLGNLPLVSCPDQVTDNILEIILDSEMSEERLQNPSSQYWWLGVSTLVAAGLALMG